MKVHVVSMKRVWPVIDSLAVAERAGFIRKGIGAFRGGKSVAMKGFGLSPQRVKVYTNGIQLESTTVADVRRSGKDIKRLNLESTLPEKENVLDTESKLRLRGSHSISEMCKELGSQIGRGRLRVVNAAESSVGIRKRWQRWVSVHGGDESVDTTEYVNSILGVSDIVGLAGSEGRESVEQALKIAVVSIRLPVVVIEALVDGCLKHGMVAEAADVVILSATHGVEVGPSDENDATQLLGNCRGVVEQCRNDTLERVARELVRVGAGSRAMDVLHCRR